MLFFELFGVGRCFFLLFFFAGVCCLLVCDVFCCWFLWEKVVRFETFQSFWREKLFFFFFFGKLISWAFSAVESCRTQVQGGPRSRQQVSEPRQKAHDLRQKIFFGSAEPR